jgi:hypothetical protein
MTVTTGIITQNMADQIGAIVDFNRAIELNPKDADASFHQGYSKLARKDKTGVCADWNKAAEPGDKKASQLIKENCL